MLSVQVFVPQSRDASSPVVGPRDSLPQQSDLLKNQSKKTNPQNKEKKKGASEKILQTVQNPNPVGDGGGLKLEKEGGQSRSIAAGAQDGAEDAERNQPRDWERRGERADQLQLIFVQSETCR